MPVTRYGPTYCVFISGIIPISRNSRRCQDVYISTVSNPSCIVLLHGFTVLIDASDATKASNTTDTEQYVNYALWTMLLVKYMQ